MSKPDRGVIYKTVLNLCYNVRTKARDGVIIFIMAVQRRWPGKGLWWHSYHDKPPARPTGKLGDILQRLEFSSPVSLHDLMVLTGWQRHTVHAALSRLRSRGYVIQRERGKNTAVYCLGPSGQGLKA